MDRFPARPELLKARDLDLEHIRRSYIKHTVGAYPIDKRSDVDLKFLAEETNTDLAFVKSALGI